MVGQTPRVVAVGQTPGVFERVLEAVGQTPEVVERVLEAEIENNSTLAPQTFTLKPPKAKFVQKHHVSF